MPDRATKMLILSSARTLFSEKGYDETSVEEICALAGVAKGTFFYYFESKQFIVRYIAEMQLREFCAKLKGQLDTMRDAMSKLEYLVAALIERSGLITEPEGYFKNGDCEWFRTVIIEERMKSVYPLMESVVDEGIREGLFKVKNPGVCAAVIFMGIDSYVRAFAEDNEQVRDGIREITAKTMGLKENALVI